MLLSAAAAPMNTIATAAAAVYSGGLTGVTRSDLLSACLTGTDRTTRAHAGRSDVEQAKPSRRGRGDGVRHRRAGRERARNNSDNAGLRRTHQRWCEDR